MTLAIDIILFTILVISLVTDLRSGKIYNTVTMPSIIAGICLNAIASPGGAFVGFLNSFYGIALAIAVFILPYFIGALGAGDVKLLMAIGALKGHIFMFYAILAIGLVSFLLSAMVFAMDLMKNYKFSGILNMAVIYFNNRVMVSDDELKPLLKRNLKFGVSIAFGTIFAYIYLKSR